MKVKYLIALVLVSFALSACKNKKPKNPDQKVSDTKENVSVSKKVDAELLNKANNIYDWADNYQSVELQYSLKLQSPERNLSASATLRVNPGEVMWLHIKALGFEAARAKFTNDSVMAVVKLKNQYFKGDYSSIQKLIPVAADYKTLESVFLNRMFVFPENKKENLSYFAMEMTDNKTMHLSPFSMAEYVQKFGFSNNITVDTDIQRLVKSSVNIPQQNKDVTITYSDYADFSGHLMPKVIEIAMGETSVTFVVSKVTFDKTLQFPLSIPDSYKPFQF